MPSWQKAQDVSKWVSCSSKVTDGLNVNVTGSLYLYYNPEKICDRYTAYKYCQRFRENFLSGGAPGQTRRVRTRAVYGRLSGRRIADRTIAKI